MRNISFLLTLFFLLFLTMIGLSCSQGGPIMLDPLDPAVAQSSFATGLTARFNADTGEVWIGAPQYISAPRSEVRITVPGELTRRVQSLPDGSFLYRFPGDASSTALVEWNDPSGVPHTENVRVTDPADGIQLNIGQASLYPNRITVRDNNVWVVNSGDDELTAYDLATLQPTGAKVTTPPWSNPWEAAFSSPIQGLLTTLFGGVFQFDTDTQQVEQVAIGAYRDFASPNGCAVVYGNGWVANPNPISYFPTELGQGWISEIALGQNPVVVGEIDTQWLNPQHVISDDVYIYASCSGTIDFIPPDYIATALTPGGVHVIDPVAGKIIASYQLGNCGPGPMALRPDRRSLYVGSAVAGWLFRIDLQKGRVLNDASNPIVISDVPGTFIPSLEITPAGLLICPSFNTDTIHFVDSWTGEPNPFPFFEPLKLHPDDPTELYGIQDIAVCNRGGETGLLVLTTVESAFHWIPL